MLKKSIAVLIGVLAVNATVQPAIALTPSEKDWIIAEGRRWCAIDNFDLLYAELHNHSLNATIHQRVPFRNETTEKMERSGIIHIEVGLAAYKHMCPDRIGFLNNVDFQHGWQDNISGRKFVQKRMSCHEVLVEDYDYICNDR